MRIELNEEHYARDKEAAQYLTAEEDEYLAGIIPRLKLRRQRKAERLEDPGRGQGTVSERRVKEWESRKS